MKRSPIKRQSSAKAKQLRLEKAVKEFILTRSDGRCEACQARGLSIKVATTKHERIMRSLGGDPLDPDNCLAVCNPCHAWIHANPSEATSLKLLKSNSRLAGFRLYDERTCSTERET